ncbi:MAG: hypothetical protein R3E68_15320 [Burkholderiaceae bacterium]
MSTNPTRCAPLNVLSTFVAFWISTPLGARGAEMPSLASVAIDWSNITVTKSLNISGVIGPVPTFAITNQYYNNGGFSSPDFSQGSS